MARLRRTHVEGGVHYVILHSNDGRDIFLDPEDYLSFTRLVERCVRACHARVYAFCWTAHELHFALQVSTLPLGRLIQRLASQHARRINRKLRQRGHLFQQRYWAVLLDQHTALPEVVRYIHLVPVKKGLTAEPADHPWTSHHAYLGYAKTAWVTTGTVFRMLESPGRYRRAAYRQFLQEGLDQLEPRPDGEISEAAGRTQDAEFLTYIAPRRRRTLDPALLDRIIDSVANRLAVPREAILSPSRRRCLSLARALVAWHATCNDVATLTQVAQCFQRNPSTLCVGVERYRKTQPALFGETFNDLLGIQVTNITPPPRDRWEFPN